MSLLLVLYIFYTAAGCVNSHVDTEIFGCCGRGGLDSRHSRWTRGQGRVGRRGSHLRVQSIACIFSCGTAWEYWCTWSAARSLLQLRTRRPVAQHCPCSCSISSDRVPASRVLESATNVTGWRDKASSAHGASTHTCQTCPQHSAHPQVSCLRPKMRTSNQVKQRVSQGVGFIANGNIFPV